MSKQIDVGWTSPPLGIKEIDEGKIRVVARGSDLPGMDGQTIRVVTTNVNVLQTRAADVQLSTPIRKRSTICIPIRRP